MARTTRLSAYQVKLLNSLGIASKGMGLGDYLQGLESNNIIVGQPRRMKLVDPAAASTTSVHAAITLTASTQTVTTAITNPAHARIIKLTSAKGGASEIQANVILHGTNIKGQAISETIAIDTTGDGAALTDVSTKAFKTITSIDLPVRANTGDTIAFGVDDVFGLDMCMEGDAVLAVLVDGVYETTRPTVTFDASLVEKNTLNPNTAMDGSRDYIVYFVPVVQATG